MKTKANFIYQIIKELNGIQVSELKSPYKEFVLKAFPYIQEEDFVTAKRIYTAQKGLILVSYNHKTAYVNVLYRDCEVLHDEQIYSFTSYLNAIGFSQKFTDQFLVYHWGDNTTNNTGKIRYTVEEFKNLHPFLIAKLNSNFNNIYVYPKIIERILFHDELLPKKIEYIFLNYKNKPVFYYYKDMLQLLIDNAVIDNSFLHIGPFSVQNKKRCVNFDELYDQRRNMVSIKWYNYDQYLDKIYKNATIPAKN